MAQNRKNVAYIKLPCGGNSQKVEVTKVGKMAVICTQEYGNDKEILDKCVEELPKSVLKYNGENF